MDGVRRRRSEGPATIMLRPAATAVTAEVAMPMPNSWAPSGTFDGLRRVARNNANVVMPNDTSDRLIATPTRKISPWAMAGLAAIPMITVASVAGARTLLADRDTRVEAAQASAVNVTQAQPVAATDQAATTAPSSTSLQQLIDGFGMSSTYSLYVKDLKTGQLAVSNPDKVMDSASLYKLFVADGIYQRIDAGKLSYDSQAGGGTGNTIAGCLNLMITISDNGCGRALGGLLNWNTWTQQLRSQGYDATDLTGLYTQTSPRNVATLYERLYAGTLLGPDSTNQFMNLLKAQKVNNRLPQGLPAGTTIAHKTGDLDGYTHDAGIVFGPKTDYLVVMMGAPGSQPSDFASLNQKLYSFFNK